MSNPSKYDIAERFAYCIGRKEFAIVEEQARLQAAFCEAYEAKKSGFESRPPLSLMPTAEQYKEWDKWQSEQRGRGAALDAAWTALQNYNKEVGE